MLPIYCLSFQNEIREKRMRDAFASLDLEVQMCKGVDPMDSRILGRPLESNAVRTWSTCYGHLDMIREFLTSEQEMGIFCEDDIIIRKDFGERLPQIAGHFRELGLDILLFGFLCDNDIRRHSNFPEKNIRLSKDFPFRYYDYCVRPESGVWGTQMYMLSREHALELCEKYEDYADQTINCGMTPFSSDWIITKTAKNRALIYPLMVIEDGRSKYTDLGQDQTRTRCFDFSYTEELFGSMD